MFREEEEKTAKDMRIGRRSSLDAGEVLGTGAAGIEPQQSGRQEEL